MGVLLIKIYTRRFGGAYGKKSKVGLPEERSVGDALFGAKISKDNNHKIEDIALTQDVRNRRDLQRGTDDEQQVHIVPIFFERAVKIVCQLFAEERDIRLEKRVNRISSQCLKVLTFMIPGGYVGASLSSSQSLSHSPLAFFLLIFLPFFGVDDDDDDGGLHTGHNGTFRRMMSDSISDPGTRLRQSKQVAVAKEP